MTRSSKKWFKLDPKLLLKASPLCSSSFTTLSLSALSDGPALIILALVTANVRTCLLPSSKVRALDVFLALAGHLTDEAKLDRMVPYIVDLVHDDTAIVRAAAVRTLTQVVRLFTLHLRETVTKSGAFAADSRDGDHTFQCSHIS